MGGLSPLEIAGLAILVVAAVWLALGSPGSMSVFTTLLSPLEFVHAVSNAADRASKDMTRPWPTRMLAALVAKVGFGALLLLVVAVIGVVLWALFARWNDVFHWL